MFNGVTGVPPFCLHGRAGKVGGDAAKMWGNFEDLLNRCGEAQRTCRKDAGKLRGRRSCCKNAEKTREWRSRGASKRLGAAETVSS